MDLKPKQGLDRPEVETTRNPAEACDASWDSRDPCSGVRGRSGRGNVPVTPPKSASGARTSVRVLRARSAAADGRSGRENGTCDQKPGRVRGAPVLSRSSHTPVMQTATKKSKARKASQPTLSPKMPKRGRGRQRLPLSATECKPEAETEAPMSGEETGTVTRSSDNVADPVTGVDENPSFRDDPDGLVCKPQTKMDEPRQCPTSQPTDVKKEEPEEEDKEKGIREELRGMSVQSEDGVGNNTAPPSRKRGRQQKDDKGPRQPKRRKKPPVQYVRCEIEGCGTVLAHPRYLQHHIKYQHLLKKKYVCDHPSCGRLFRLQKQLLRHAKHHTDQRDYICEYCARAFKSSHNLSVHRMIHTGEKPIQCEICGFTCRQKASLNWHMKKHDAEASYQCSCSICGKKFEKKDCVIAHKAKSHPEVLIAEALAANGGSVISSPTPVPETALVPAQPEGAEGDMFTPLQQVVLSFAPQAPVDGSQGHFLQLPTHPEVAPQHTPTLLQLTTTSPVHSSSISHPQHIQLSTFPASTVTPMTTFDSQSSPLTLNSITTLSSTDTLAPQQTVQWNREGNEGAQILRESELWNGCQQGVAEITWEGNGETKTEIEGITWEREGERQIMLQCADVHGDGLM